MDSFKVMMLCPKCGDVRAYSVPPNLRNPLVCDRVMLDYTECAGRMEEIARVQVQEVMDKRYQVVQRIS